MMAKGWELGGIKRDQKLNCCMQILGEAIAIVVNGALTWTAKLQDASRESRELGKRNDRDMAASKVFPKAFSTQTATDAPSVFHATIRYQPPKHQSIYILQPTSFYLYHFRSSF